MTDTTGFEAQRRAFRDAASPVRWRAYMLLGFLGPQRVGSLARMINVSRAIMTRHLEALAATGLVEEVGEGRDRRWRRAQAEDPSDLSSGRFRVDYEDEAGRAIIATREFGEWLKVSVSTGAALVSEFIDQRMSIGEEWRAAGEIQDYVLLLNPDELAELGEQLQQVVASRLTLTRMRQQKEDLDPTIMPIYVATHAVRWQGAEGWHRE